MKSKNWLELIKIYGSAMPTQMYGELFRALRNSITLDAVLGEEYQNQYWAHNEFYQAFRQLLLDEGLGDMGFVEKVLMQLKRTADNVKARFLNAHPGNYTYVQAGR